MIEAVTFDHWNTLVHEDPGEIRGRRIDAWAGILEDAGFATEREALDVVFEASWRRFVQAWQAGDRQYTAVEAAVDILEDLGYDVPPDVHDALVATYSRTGEPVTLHLAEGIVECLRALRAAGVRVGIVCDVGFTPSTVLLANLERHGLLPMFDHWSFSDEVGVYKPSPVIFDHALRGLGGVAPERAAHVGDLKRTDVAGAQAFGMVAVRYTGVHDDAESDGPEADHVIDHHGKLLDVLGLA